MITPQQFWLLPFQRVLTLFQWIHGVLLLDVLPELGMVNIQLLVCLVWKFPQVIERVFGIAPEEVTGLLVRLTARDPQRHDWRGRRLVLINTNGLLPLWLPIGLF